MNLREAILLSMNTATKLEGREYEAVDMVASTLTLIAGLYIQIRDSEIKCWELEEALERIFYANSNSGE